MRFPLFVLALGLAACGHDVAPAAAAKIQAPGADAVAAGGSGSSRCAPGQRLLKLAAGSQVRWVVAKSDGVPVVGTHAVSGTLAVASDGTLAAPAMTLQFSDGGALTGLSLRDERLRRVIFKAQDALPFAFTLKAVETPGGQAALKLPDVGGGAQLVLSGDFTMAGATVPVTMPVLVESRATGIAVTEGLGGIHWDLRKTLQLGAAVDALMALVNNGVTVGDELQARVDLMMEEVCREEP